MQTVDFRHFDLRPGDVVLDLGCGEGRHVIASYLEKDVHAVGVDLSHDDLKTTVEKFQPFEKAALDSAASGQHRSFTVSQANALSLPFADNSFDSVICSEVLEHIPDYEGALQEVERILKPGGYFVASVPRYWPEWICWALSDEYHANEGGHLRIFKAAKLRAQIEQLGMQFYRRHWAHALHAPFWWLKCMFWSQQEKSWLVRTYHKLLVWDLMEKPWITRTVEALLNPLMGKSVVMYFRKGLAS